MKAPEEIRTKRLVLRQYKLEDAADIFGGYTQDEEVTRYLTWKPHRGLEETKAFVKGRMDAWTQGNDFTWATTMVDGKLIGGIAFRIGDFKADFGYVIGRPYWGHG